MEGRRCKSGLCSTWLDGVKYAKLVNLRDAKAKCMDGGQWREVIYGTNGGMNVLGFTEHTSDARQ